MKPNVITTMIVSIAALAGIGGYFLLKNKKTEPVKTGDPVLDSATKKAEPSSTQTSIPAPKPLSPASVSPIEKVVTKTDPVISTEVKAPTYSEIVKQNEITAKTSISPVDVNLGIVPKTTTITQSVAPTTTAKVTSPTVRSGVPESMGTVSPPASSSPAISPSPAPTPTITATPVASSVDIQLGLVPASNITVSAPVRVSSPVRTTTTRTTSTVASIV